MLAVAPCGDIWAPWRSLLCGLGSNGENVLHASGVEHADPGRPSTWTQQAGISFFNVLDGPPVVMT